VGFRPARDHVFEVLDAEQQLVGVEPLRAPPELPTLQLPDQQPQPFELGLGGLLPGLSSITLDPQCHNGYVLLGDDFSHLLRHRQHPIGITWRIIRDQRHSVIVWPRSWGASPSAHPAVLGRGVVLGWSRCHGKPSSRLASLRSGISSPSVNHS
jgi:hypothetical protein